MGDLEILQNELSGEVGIISGWGITFLSNSPYFSGSNELLLTCVFAITSMLFSNHYALALFLQ